MDDGGFSDPRGSLDFQDLLLGMSTDAGDEFVPVDAFFGSYVEELNSRSKRSHEPGGDAGGGKAVKLAPGQTAGVAGLPSCGMMGMGMPPQPQAGVAGGMQPPFMAAGGQLPLGGGMLGMPGQPVPSAPLNGATMGGLPQMGGAGVEMPLGLMGMGSMPGEPFVGAGARAGAGAPGGGLMGLGLDMPLPGAAAAAAAAGYGGSASGDGRNASATLSGGEASGDGGEGGKQRKTLKQQEANKIAQQRYRERKKQKFHEMEETIEQLSKQLQALQALQNRNQILEGINGELQSQLMHREREVERLKVALDVAAERSLGSQPSSPSADGGVDGAPLDFADDGCVTCNVLPRDLAGIDYKKGFSDQVELLRQFLQQHGLADGVVPEGGMSRELVNELAQLVGRSCQLCQAALRSEGVKVMELISKDPSSFSTVGSAAEQQRWQACLGTMALSEEQQEQLLLSRRSHLQHMRAIYQERHNLNMQAMSLMLPHSSRNPAEDNTVEGRLASMSQAGYLPVARSSAELGDVLDKIKDNLRREQRAVMDLNCLLMSKILSPLQGARYMLGAYPHHCDALALSNTLAKQMGREAVSDGVPPANGGAAEAGSGGCVGAGRGAAPAVGCC